MATQTTALKDRLFADCEFQAALLIRASIYGAAGMLYFGITLVCTQWIHDSDRGFSDSLWKCLEDVVYWLPGFLLLAPLAANDLLKMTNQFARPITRLRQEMKSLVEGKSDRPLSFSDDECWSELSAAYNQIRGELLQLRKRLGEEERDLPPSLLSLDAESDDDSAWSFESRSATPLISAPDQTATEFASA
ncbi:MAG: hypothetical protein ACO1RT_20305 [Planctomycetaceae bacterium]